MTIYIGADHNGYEVKQRLIDYLISLNHEVIDDGDLKLIAEDDFPLFASKVVEQLLSDKNDPAARGILICGSGQGMCMAANRYKGIRASLCWNVNEAYSARNDDDSNILCLSSRQLKPAEMQRIVNVWLTTPFANAPRFIRRIKQLDSLG